MKKVWIILFILAASLLIYLLFRNEEHNNLATEAPAISLKKNSPRFNDELVQVIEEYMKVKDAFVEADTAAVKRLAINLLQKLDSIPLEELRADSAQVYQTAVIMRDDIKSNFASMITQKNISEMRKDFSMAGDLMYPGFLKLINYEGPKIYLQHCPMAFGEEMGANWISSNAEIVNPYLGKNDPTYGAGMLHCGEVKDSLGGR